ncbi:hypothetical protein AX16_003838 [Volvariella volvacea WC 439]|nr:hypothetical protein AX16_003838 [Volvariella volvacea WC 439]
MLQVMKWLYVAFMGVEVLWNCVNILHLYNPTLVQDTIVPFLRAFGINTNTLGLESTPHLGLSLLIGSAMLISGSIIRQKCYDVMKEYFTVVVTELKEHKLVTSGPYSFARHPSYLGAMMMSVGCGIIIYSPGIWYHSTGAREVPWISRLVYIWCLYCIGTAFLSVVRMDQEDEILKRRFGKEWEEYAKRVPSRLIPGILILSNTPPRALPTHTRTLFTLPIPLHLTRSGSLPAFNTRHARTQKVLFSSTSSPKVLQGTHPIQSHNPNLDGPPPSSTSFSDPSRPDLFYHLLEPPTPLPASSSHLPAFAISFLPGSPPRKDSKTIIGWLPAQTSAAAQSEHMEGSLPEEVEAEGAGLNDFRENPRFKEILHEAIRSGLRDGVDEIQINGAIQLQHGWMHIHDERNPPPLGRIGDPDDILATVLVEDGKILPDTYQPMPAYRFCTADGVIQLTPGLHERLREILLQEAEAEKAEIKSGST